jgi:iron(III) transport system permease protein
VTPAASNRTPLPSRTAFPLRFSTRLVWFSLLGGGLMLLPLGAILITAAGGETTADLWPHLFSNVLPRSLATTALLLTGVALLSGIIGVLSAWAVTQHEFTGRRWLDWLLILPLALPTYITAYAYVEVLGFQGPFQSLVRSVFGYQSLRDYWFPDVRSQGGAILIFSLVLYPYIYLSTRALFTIQAASIMEAARILGAAPGRLFWQIGLPMARPALAAGVTLVMLETLNDIGATQYLGIPTLTLSVYTTWLNRGSLAGAAQIACLLVLVIALLMLFEARLRGQKRFAIPVRQTRMLARRPLSTRTGYAVALGCLIPVIAGFVLPAGYLLLEVLQRGWLSQADSGLFKALLSTVIYSGLATAIALLLACGVVAALRFGRERWLKASARLAGLGYAVPGTVLALGLLVPFGLIDNLVANTARAWLGFSPGLLIMGSGAALVLAYVTRFLSVALSGLESGMARISPRMDEAGRSLGASPREVIETIHWPLARPALAAAALLVFVDCMKELPATLLLRPLNVETLATVVYGHAARGSFEDGALAALLIVIAGLYPVIRLARDGNPVVIPP